MNYLILRNLFGFNSFKFIVVLRKFVKNKGTTLVGYKEQVIIITELQVSALRTLTQRNSQ